MSAPTITTVKLALHEAAARRGLRFGDAFTAFYSSIFAIAAIADAKAKDARRRKWDEAIAEVRDDIQVLDRKQQSRVKSSPSERPMDEEMTISEQMSWRELFNMAKKEKKTRIALGFQGLKGIPLDLLEELSASEIGQLLPEVVCDDSETDFWRGWKSDRYFHRGFSTKKLKIFELSISKLVLRFLLDSRERRDATLEEPEAPVTIPQVSPLRYRDLVEKQIANIDIRISALSHIRQWPLTSIDLESPNRPQYLERFIDGTLYDALRTVILEWEEDKADCNTLTSRICYSLLVSSTPPDVHTYNMLIVVLSRLRQDNFVRALLESMLECHTPRNEITITAALKFYTATSDGLGFERYVKLVGSKYQVLDLHQPATTILSWRREVLPNYLHKRRQVVRPNEVDADPILLVIQRAPRSQAVLEALFCGALKFLGLSQARYCYRALVEEGWEVNVRILVLMLKRCARQNYWRLGRLVWLQLHDLALQATNKAYNWMLYLCYKRRKGRMFHAVLMQASRLNITLKIPSAWILSPLDRRIAKSHHKIIHPAKQVNNFKSGLYGRPSTGHLIKHKPKMLNLDSNTIPTVTVQIDREQDLVSKKDKETRLLPGPVRKIIVDEAKDRRRGLTRPQMLPPPSRSIFATFTPHSRSVLGH
ncbi:MAG: hypothetical protein LQ347_005870 [Umbilicaria vellea]|nr:MAG: hypothetical protein LQ347_005870 [Umbilicaria vellea]